jgi:hypothetical protein
MKVFLVFAAITAFGVLSPRLNAQSSKIDLEASESASTPGHKKATKSLYLDVHHMGPGKVSAEAVAGAHAKDLAVEKKYGVNLINYWLDEKNGTILCLAEAPSAEALVRTHKEAHGLLPEQVYSVTSGKQERMKGKNQLFLDIHELGEGKVTAKDVAEAHKKDLAVQKKYGVNLINYWLDEKTGTIMCLAQAPDSTSLIKTHKDAHGLVPVKVVKVKQGE